MDYRSPLQHLLHKLLPPARHADKAAHARDFEDTRPEERRATTPLRPSTPAPRRLDAWSQTAIDLDLGTEIVEFPDTATADLMDEYFAGSARRAS